MTLVELVGHQWPGELRFSEVRIYGMRVEYGGPRFVGWMLIEEGT